MRAFVTGATGFIGSRLATRLRERGDEVVALVRRPSRAAHLADVGCRLVEGDLTDANVIASGVAGCDATFHVAAVYRVGIPDADRAAMRQVNVGGTELVVDASIAAGVRRIVYVSTANVFGNTRGQVVDETYRRPPGDFLSWYDRTKWEAHQVVLERIVRGAPIVVVMPTVVYGPGDHSEIGAIIEQVHRGRLPAISFADMGLVMAFVDDVVTGILAAHDRGRVGESYVLGGDRTTMRDLVRIVAELAGRRPPRLVVPGAMIRASIPIGFLVTRLMGLPPNLGELVRASDGVTYWARDDKARAELGYAPRDLRTGLRQTFAAV